MAKEEVIDLGDQTLIPQVGVLTKRKHKTIHLSQDQSLLAEIILLEEGAFVTFTENTEIGDWLGDLLETDAVQFTGGARNTEKNEKGEEVLVDQLTDVAIRLHNIDTIVNYFELEGYDVVVTDD